MMAAEASTPAFSVVIPAYNEAGFLPRLLDTVDQAKARYTGGADKIEVIVADNESRDDTAEVARNRGCLVTQVAERNIGRVRNTGARIASGEILCFVDADMRIHPATFDSIERAIGSGKVIAGATGIRMERMSLGIALTYAVLIPIAYLTKIDTGVVFCRRADFASVGGYDEALQIGEDVQFLTALRELGRPRGQRLARLPEAKALSSTRKWDEHGEWHFLTIMLNVARSGGFGAGLPSKFLQRYWYGDQREP